MADLPVLSDEELSRYARHIVLPEIGGVGQRRLKDARVLVVGAGALGAPVLLYLAAAGVGSLAIVDDDTVSLSNLQRQVIHETQHVGTAKTESAARQLARINPHIVVTEHRQRFDASNAGELISACDLVMDCTDNFDARYLIADTCERLERPLVTGAVSRFDGSVTVLSPHTFGPDGRKNPRFRDLFPEQPPEGLVPSCAVAGVVGALTGVIGTVQAMEAIKLITGAGEPLIGRLLLYDALAARFDTIRYARPRER